MSRINVMHLIDTLDAGGAERVAVNIANLLPREKYCVHLCTTRREGLLAATLEKDVGRISLMRRSRFDWRALQRLSEYVRSNQIRLLHAHGTALFVAVLARLRRPFPEVIWHDHYGAYAITKRHVFPYWLLTRKVSAVIAVNRTLEEWARQRLHIPDCRIYYVPNFVVPAIPPSALLSDLPGKKGSRIVCVANFRPQKDHITLLRAMAIVARRFNDASLLLVGAQDEAKQNELIRKKLADLGIRNNVYVLGIRRDVGAILWNCDIGVISSVSEGFPLALIEYGLAGLPVVVTSVGQCPEIVDEGHSGILVPPGSPENMAEALLSLLTDNDKGKELGMRFKRRVQELYNPKTIINRISEIYENVLSPVKGRRN
jgi:glycosyltransferase involved in cell wall biosynthesis